MSNFYSATILSTNPEFLVLHFEFWNNYSILITLNFCYESKTIFPLENYLPNLLLPNSSYKNTSTRNISSRLSLLTLPLLLIMIEL